MSQLWPRLPVTDWQETRDTLHLWTQIVGKVRMAVAPEVNHWWNVALYVNAVGLTTSLMPYRGFGFEIIFDFTAHELLIVTTTGERRRLTLRPRSVADFYAEFAAHLDELGIGIAISRKPVEIAEIVPFDEDEEHASYDADAVHAYWLSLVNAERVLSVFRASFRGKASPVHFFWGAFDLAVTRFSGRPAPPHPGGIPNCPDRVMVEAYSDEVSSCGYWPGGADEGVFYAYAYPEPPGYSDAALSSADARYESSMGEFVLPYAAVRQAPDPDAYLLSFLNDTHAAAADLAGWPTD
jgi:hypothetical protein